MTCILVTGGNGYIGSHFVRALQQMGMEYVVLDSLVRSRSNFVPDSGLIRGDIGDRELVERICTENDVDVIVHFAAFAYVGESVLNPRLYYENNVVKTKQLLDAALASGVRALVFSSSCATYGNADGRPISENDRQDPVNPYGETKLVVERMLRHYGAYGLRSISLRYFNASGAAGDVPLFEDHEPETHLIPLAIRALSQERPLTIFGTDYDTPDGTCIRDYVHVEDLAEAHFAAVQKLRSGASSDQINLGIGRGYSVRDVIAAVERCSGRQVHVTNGGRRPGDPPILVADPRKARTVLGWSPKYSNIDDIVKTALVGEQRRAQFVIENQ